MTIINRGVIGNRNNGDIGAFISAPGFDADTTSDSNLRLNITVKVSQLLLMGRVSAGSYNIALGLGRSPYAFITSQWDFAGVAGHTLGPGPFRPSPPLPAAAASSIAIIGNGASMDVSASFTCVYQVYGQAYT